MMGDGSVYKRGNVYWMKYYIDGRAHAESTGCSVKEDAKKCLREKIGKTRAPGWLPPEKARITVAELVADLLSVYELESKDGPLANAKLCWRKHLEPFFGTTAASTLGTQHFRDYQKLRLSQPGKSEGSTAANATVNRELQVIYAALKNAFESEPPKLHRVPKIPKLPEDNARKVFIDQELTAKLKQAAAQRSLEARTWLELAFTYGWRRGELLGLRVSNIMLADRAIRIEDTKNGDGREVWITDAILPLITALVTGKPKDAKLLPWNEDTIYTEWANICKAAGVEAGRDGFIPHDIRRSSARNKSAAGVAQHVIMDIHGWRTDEMFRRYAIVDRVNQVQALQQEAAALPPSGGNA